MESLQSQIIGNTYNEVYYRFPTKLKMVMFSVVSVHRSKGSHVTITNDALDLTIQAQIHVQDMFNLQLTV